MDYLETISLPRGKALRRNKGEEELLAGRDGHRVGASHAGDHRRDRRDDGRATSASE